VAREREALRSESLERRTDHVWEATDRRNYLTVRGELADADERADGESRPGGRLHRTDVDE
jgi:hypothetical protein